MRIGVYVDGYNLYYGGRAHAGGNGIAGWRWLDVRGLALTLIKEQGADWAGSQLAHIVYCTARISGAENPSGAHDQDIYLKALLATGSVDHIEYGYYTAKVKTRPLAVTGSKKRPQLVHPAWPVKIKTSDGTEDPNAIFMVSVADREEKGSDVNVATHLLLDIFQQRVDAAMIVSNDSDLALPISEARKHVTVGMINPGINYTAGALSGDPSDGVGGHWWRQLKQADFTTHQLPNPAGHYHCPPGW